MSSGLGESKVAVGGVSQTAKERGREEKKTAVLAGEGFTDGKVDKCVFCEHSPQPTARDPPSTVCRKTCPQLRG